MTFGCSHAHLLHMDAKPVVLQSILFLFVLVLVVSTVIGTAIFACIAVAVEWCKHGGSVLPRSQPQRLSQPGSTMIREVEDGLENSFPRYKYSNESLVGLGAITCLVCLSELHEGEEVRRLPNCMHIFHVPCIDMWLYSHANCPLCRADTTLPPYLKQAAPPISIRLPDFGG